MKIVIEIECTIEGKWKDTYRDELINSIVLTLPGIVVVGTDYCGCDVILESSAYTIKPDQEREYEPV